MRSTSSDCGRSTAATDDGRHDDPPRAPAGPRRHRTIGNRLHCPGHRIKPRPPGPNKRWDAGPREHRAEPGRSRRDCLAAPGWPTGTMGCMAMLAQLGKIFPTLGYPEHAAEPAACLWRFAGFLAHRRSGHRGGGCQMGATASGLYRDGVRHDRRPNPAASSPFTAPG
jgi:hypothetical protein